MEANIVMEIIQKNKLIISSQTGGRLGNQLYFVLQAFCISKRNNIPCKYTMSRTIAPATNILQYSDILNISQHLTTHTDNIQFLKLNKYYQYINTDFQVSELNEFISNSILKCQYLKNHIKTEDCVAIHIRNGDYLRLPFHNCFDRYSFLEKAIKLIKTFNAVIDTVKIYSDDNYINIQLYDNLLKTYFNKVEYVSNSQMIDDFLELCTYKYKIIWNSTFDYWSSFVADLLYNNTNVIICPKYTNQLEETTLYAKDNWNIL